MSPSRLISKAKEQISQVKGRRLTVDERIQKAVELAGLMLEAACQQQTRSERQQQQQLARMMSDKSGKVFTTCMTDQCFRSQRPSRVADQMVYLIQKYGVPHYLSKEKQMSLSAFRLLGKPFASMAIPLTKHLLRKETARVILPGEESALFKHMRSRAKEGVRVNLNHLGEAILGEEEASQRLEIYLKDLENPNVEYISIKISTICSQLNLLAWEDTLEILCSRLKRLYRAAKSHEYVKPDGSRIPKFVNLDMEEYRDLSLTVDLFQNVLDDPEFFGCSAGIVLQSYIPDSYLIQQQLTIWAVKRVANGGAPIKIRIVKGANLGMEQVEASLRQWKQAPYETKGEVDANFKRMISYGCQPEHAHAAHLGIGSHNLFDIAYGLLLRSENEVEGDVCFEMLEGMADHMRQVVQALSGDMLLYCPAATKDEFQNAVAYLIRRLDENTAPENFLRQAFDLVPGSDIWKREAERFAAAVKGADSVSSIPRRGQNRFALPEKAELESTFVNEDDTDFSLPQNRKWVETLMKEWLGKDGPRIPLVIGGKEQYSHQMAPGEDPSIPGKTLYEYSIADQADLNATLDTAAKAQKKWEKVKVRERAALLIEVAHQLRCKRGTLIGVMIADSGKTVPEADSEISEAIDFAEYYARNLLEVTSLEDIAWKAKGVVLVAPPWNFPCSIPAGGILAALAGGNSVIFKPAPETVWVAWELAQVVWAAGIGKDVLQFFTCDDEPVGSLLVQDPRVSCVVLTGATATAKLFMKLKPGIDLLAETGGKNAMIVTDLADRDLAVKDIIQSAFGHSGQKCSACSLLICEKEVYHDSHFRQQLRDAAASWRVGSSWNLATRLNPLIREPNPTLLRGLTRLEDGEEWLLKPVQDLKNPRQWSPGIKWGVKPGSFTHQNELFGPVLGVMCADNLSEAIELVNSTRYGLTAGLHSLDDREKEQWIEKIEAGNCYINRSMTGAIVQRQPFGGCKDSSFGPGAKAGGPNYLMELMHPAQVSLPHEIAEVDQITAQLSQAIEHFSHSEEEKALWEASIGSYAFYWNYYFSQDHDPSGVQGQDNILRYLSHHNLLLRVNEGDQPLDVMRAIAGAMTCGATMEVSVPSGFSLPAEVNALEAIHVVEETDAEFLEKLPEVDFVRLRFISTPDAKVQQALANLGILGIVQPVLANGRIELLNYLREASFSIDYHRYGNLGDREEEYRQRTNPEEAASCGNGCGCV